MSSKKSRGTMPPGGTSTFRFSARCHTLNLKCMTSSAWTINSSPSRRSATGPGDSSAATAIPIVSDAIACTASGLLYREAQYDESQNGYSAAPMAQSLGKVASSFSVVLPQWGITAITLAATQ